jgi:hypothetical protein
MASEVSVDGRESFHDSSVKYGVRGVVSESMETSPVLRVYSIIGILIRTESIVTFTILGLRYAPTVLKVHSTPVASIV